MYLTSRCKKLFISFLLISMGFGCSSSQKKILKAPSEHPVLLISFDGFRYDYFSKKNTPNFDQFAAEGIKANGLIPVFPTKTFPNHYSIATGLYPENSGLVGNTMYDPEFEEWYRIRDREAVENKKWYKGEPIWNTVENQGLRAGTLFWVGSEAAIQNRQPTYWKRYDGSISGTARIDTVVKWLGYPDEKRVDFATLYFADVDGAGHRYGLQSDSLTAAISRADSLLGYLRTQLQQQNLWGNINILIVSDHGMTPLAEDKIIALESIVDTAKVKLITTGPVAMMEPNDGQVETVYNQLKKNEKYYRVYKKENLPERYHLKNNRRVPSIIVVADLGYMIMKEQYRKSFVESLPSAMHGFDNNQKAMQGIFMAQGPAFKKNFKVPSFENIHIYELMAHLLNLKPSPNDGSLQSVNVMLKRQ